MLADQVYDAVSALPMPYLKGRGAFVCYLRFCYGIMLATEHLLELAHKQSPKGMLKEYYSDAMSGERGHAQWIVEDLLAVDEPPPTMDHACAWIAGAQYYYLHHVGTEPLLGYIAALEMRPPTMETVRELEKLYGTRAVRTIRHHAEADIRHADRLREVLNEVTDHRDLILYNATMTARALSFYLSERIDS
jgi:Iron-containing redox enzyme